MRNDVVDLVDLEGRVAIVTGASRGLGAATARLLAAANARVALVSRSHNLMNEVAADMPPDRALVLPTDMRDDRQIATTLSAISDRWGSADILVNNAGIVSPASYRNLSVEDWQDVIDVNLTAPFKLIKAVVPHMEEKGWGRVVNISSISAHTGGVSGGAHYSASKGGLESLTKTIARDVAASGVTVNNIAPGQIDTNPKFLSDEQRVTFNRIIPLGRLGAADDIARAVLFLVSSMADYITGATIDVNGGLLKR